jgi:hypothetical protein
VAQVHPLFDIGHSQDAGDSRDRTYDPGGQGHVVDVDHSETAAVTTPRTTIVHVAVLSVSVQIGDSAA